MKHALLLAFVVACNHGAPAPENAPPAAASPPPATAVAAAPALPAPAAPPAPGCYTPTAQLGSAVVIHRGPGAFVGSDAPVDCSPGQDAAAIYCEHVHDGCCTSGGWACNNARYVDWYAQQCGR